MGKFKSKAVLLAAGALAVAGLANTASAGVIFQDNFTGSSTTPLNGSTPTTGPAGVAWVAGSGWYDNGTQTSSNVTGNSNAYLPYAISSGHVYTLSAGLDPENTNNGWFGLGFISNTPATGVNYWFAGSGGGYLNTGPWLLVTADRGNDPASGIGGKFNPGPGNSGGYTSFTTTTGVLNMSIVLNTTQPQWTYQVFENGSSVSSVETLASNPSIVGVAIGDNGGPMATGSVSDFSLSTAPVPEPAALGLLGTAAMGLLLVARKQKMR